MKVKILFLVVVTILVNVGFAEGQKKRPSPTPRALTPRQIAEKVMPSVVLIITQDENGNPLSQGSGFVYKPGLVVSNLHVFERATNAIVKNVLTGETSRAIEVVGMNARQDICVIRIPNDKFPVIPLGDSFAVKTGDDIYVASNPKGLEGSFTKGIISSVREKDRKDKRDDELLNWVKNISGETDRTLFQIDAAISPGSSGGPLINSAGQAVGIVRSSVISGQNLNFAIPIDQLLTLEMKFNHPIILAGACAFNDRLKWKLKGLVKTVQERQVDERTGKERVRSIREFDRFGNNVRYVWYGPTRTIESKREFDENGLNSAMPFEVAIKRKIDSRKFSSTQLNDDYIELSDFVAIDSLSTFDRFGNETINVQQFLGGRRITTFEYDSKRILTTVIESTGDKMIHYRMSYKVDSFGNWIEQLTEVRYSLSTDWYFSSIVKREIEYF